MVLIPYNPRAFIVCLPSPGMNEMFNFAGIFLFVRSVIIIGEYVLTFKS